MDQYLVLDIGGTFVKYAVMTAEGAFVMQGKVPVDHSNEEAMFAALEAVRDKLAGKASGGASSGGSAFAKKPQNPALPAGLQDMLGDSGELPPNLGGGLSGLLH